MVVRCPAFQQSAAAPQGRRGRGTVGRPQSCLAKQKTRDKRDLETRLQHPEDCRGQRRGKSLRWGGGVSQRGWAGLERRPPLLGDPDVQRRSVLRGDCWSYLSEGSGKVELEIENAVLFT